MNEPDNDPALAADLAVVAEQLGRIPRGVLAVAYRCPDGVPAVVRTAPRLPDGTPFPTLYYLTEPRLTAAVGRLESAGLMREMSDRLTRDPALAAAYRCAHEDYLAERNALEDLGTDFTGGGMPERVKCLHVLAAHALVRGPGTNPLGDEAVALVADGEHGGAALRGTAVPADWPRLAELPFRAGAGTADGAEEGR
ncbi:DUF501 domain-containing protein [Tomitella gaofuii]|uniref:DUF501 domain-containing protein n=1 Tax=Tomitella gaofuii TaxID=2760083 RepID=UPI002E2CEC14|nr:DUF501 domain-containing protein [Tomitella gaofuii]